MSQSYRLRFERASLKLKVNTRIPAQLVGGSGITITKTSGIWTVAFDFTGSVGSAVQAWDADLDAIAALSGTGIAVRTADTLWAQRSIAGTANEITLTNGDGVSGNPTASLPTALTFTGKTVTGGTFSGATITTSTYNGNTWTTGTGVLTLGAGKTATFSNTLTLAGTDSTTITFQGTDTYVGRTTTDTLTNKSINASSNTISNLTTAMFAANVVDTDATLAAASSTRVPAQSAIKSYVDNAITGLFWKPAVTIATTANITLSGEQTIDGTLTSASRVLVKNQSTGSQNGIYVSAAGSWTRATDMDAAAEFPSATVFVQGGTVNGDTQWTCTNNSVVVGSTSVTFAQVSGAGTYSAGTGLQLSGNQFSIDSTVATLTGAQALTNKTYNGNTWTAGTGTLTLGASKTVTVSNTLTFTGTDSSSIAFGSGGTIGPVGYSATGQIAATATNDDAAAGKVGQYIESVVPVGSPVALTNTADANINSISLTAGDWDVNATGVFLPSVTTSQTYVGVSLSLTSATFDSTNGRFSQQPTPAFVSSSVGTSLAIGPIRFSVASTTTVYLVMHAGFTVSTASGLGLLRARRVR